MKSDDWKNDPMLQVYAQPVNHFDAGIIGNRQGLLTLQKLIARALAGEECWNSVFVSDGEGYDIYVRMVEWDEAKKWPCPYTAEFEREHRAIEDLRWFGQEEK